MNERFRNVSQNNDYKFEKLDRVFESLTRASTTMTVARPLVA